MWPKGSFNSPFIFQSVMDKILQGLDQVTWHCIDCTLNRRACTVQMVEKYSTIWKSTRYWGNTFLQDILYPPEKKIATILQGTKAILHNGTENFLGHLNDGQFVKNLSHTAAITKSNWTKAITAEMSYMQTMGLSCGAWNVEWRYWLKVRSVGQVRIETLR